MFTQNQLDAALGFSHTCLSTRIHTHINTQTLNGGLSILESTVAPSSGRLGNGPQHSHSRRGSIIEVPHVQPHNTHSLKTVTTRSKKTGCILCLPHFGTHCVIGAGASCCTRDVDVCVFSRANVRAVKTHSCLTNAG